MNLYHCTLKGILAVKEARRNRLLQQMAAAAIRKADRLGAAAVPTVANPAPVSTWATACWV